MKLSIHNESAVIWDSCILYISDFRMQVGNTTPITANSRGRVYQYMRCRYNPYQGESSKVVQHFYRQHVAIDDFPYYCTICKFLTKNRT